MLVLLLVNVTPVQNFLARKAAGILARKLQTTVSIAHVRIDFKNHLLIQGLYIEDRAHDTLLYAGQAEVKITDWAFFRKETPVITYLGLHDAVGNLKRTATSNAWNYQFVVDAFNTGKKDTSTAQNEFELDLKHLELGNVRFNMDDAWGGEDIDFRIGGLVLDGKELDLKKRNIDLDRIRIRETAVIMRSYEAGKPKTPKKAPVIDTTAFNPGGWTVHARELTLEDCLYSLDASKKPSYPREFDPDHIRISGIDLNVADIRILRDTIRGRINHLAAKERSGIAITDLQADARVSPNISELANMTLRTPRSTIGNYYAMHYERFPDFLDYIYKVKMEARLENALIDADEVGYFAPEVREYFTKVRASGRYYGTVDSLSGRNMHVTDGVSTVRGDLLMVGLPDINTTFINFQNGAVVTSGQELQRYIPDLRATEYFDVSRLGTIVYGGSFTGYIDNFAANGTMHTELGVIQAKTDMKFPGMDARNMIYSGTVSTGAFNLGALLRNPDIGTVTLNGQISGTGYDPDIAGIRVNAFIAQIGLYGYNYRNITADGVLARRKFDGKLLVDDPALSGGFYGTFDFSGAMPVFHATINLGASDFQQLGLVKEPLKAVADFDLDMTGNNIDNFLGTARLYNINVQRGGHRLDIDSVYLNSSVLADGRKVLTVESNDLAARLTGTFQLSKLPYSAQYFLSQYLPNYVKAPKQYAPDQNLTFDITTRQIDSLLSTLMPEIRGFDNSTITGSLNTSSQQLTLAASVPYGRIGAVRMNNIVLNGKGNFRQIAFTGDVGNLRIGDTLLNLALNVNTTVGNDSIGFRVTTSSPGIYGTASLNGSMLAEGDSLYVTLLPSEFFLNQNRWELQGGSRIVLSHQYMYVQDVNLRSGLQRINIQTDEEETTQSLLFTARDIDLAQLGGVAGLSDYQPDGRMEGHVRLDHFYGKMEIAANLKATGVKLGADTIGEIIIAGNYNTAKGTITLSPQSGIFRDGASLTAYGTLTSDSTSAQRLDGELHLSNAPLSWLSPVLTDLVSKVSGTASGTVKVGGTGIAPEVNGTVSLNKAAFRVDYLGTYYTIPTANIAIAGNTIKLGTISVYDGFSNRARLTGNVTHDRFRDFRLSLQVRSDAFEVVNLKDYENDVFYGHVIAQLNPLSITGPINNLNMSITAAPAGESHLYLPVSTGSGIGSYSYISFRKYGEPQTLTLRSGNRLNVTINAAVDPQMEITLIIDPSTGDQINARGYGNLQMQMPAGGDLKLFGNFNIERGDYTFTFRQLFFKRQFRINSGSNITFVGPIGQTALNVEAVYTTRASLYDLLTDQEKTSNIIPANELSDAKRLQNVNVLLSMTDNILQPSLKFRLELPEKRSVGTYAYTKLERVNTNDRELFDQVASLLLIGYFIPPEGLAGSTAVTGTVNNISQILSTTTSTQLTNIVNKLLGDPNLILDLVYKNYNISDGTAANPLNRNEVKLAVRQNLLNDRLIVEYGASYDWGRPTAANNTTSNFNLLNNFRVQYLLSQDGRLRLNAFRTSDFDVLQDNRNINRSGLGLSWRKSFDSFAEFIHSSKRFKPSVQTEEEVISTDSTIIRRSIGTE